MGQTFAAVVVLFLMDMRRAVFVFLPCGSVVEFLSGSGFAFGRADAGLTQIGRASCRERV